MARQVGEVIFLGTKLGCTGYLLDGKAYIRQQSSLDGARVQRDPAFARSRAAAAVFGEGSRFASRLWRAIPVDLKRLMDAGAYNRLAGSLRDAGSLSLTGLGGVLNGLDLSAGQLLADGVQLLVRDARGGLHRELGDLLHVHTATRVGFAGLDGLLDFCGAVDAVRVRVLVACVGLPAGPCIRGLCHAFAGEWVVVEQGAGMAMVDVPAGFAGGTLQVVGLEVAVRRRGRWKRLEAACKVFVVGCGDACEGGARLEVLRRREAVWGVRGAIRWIGLVRARNVVRGVRVLGLGP